jgi:predicted chitinase
VAGLLAQAMWESGGDAPWSACDENNYTGWKTAPCTQRTDGILYAGLNDREWACDVDMNMEMTAVTHASWTPGPMKCSSSENPGCCWWGRGAIQTTGPNNYGNL